MQYGRFAQIYDVLMQEVDYDSWAEYILSFMPGEASVFECACGTGEITKRLASAGHKVIASDISEDMLRVASEKLRLMGRVSQNVRFVNMDMRNIALNRKVDCVVCCCDGVNYLLDDDDVIRFFSGAYEALKPGGLLIFDVSSVHKLKNVLGNNCFVDSGEEVAYLWQNCFDDNSCLIRMDLAFFVKTGKLYERFDETHIQRAFFAAELQKLLAECGFDSEVFGFLTRSSPENDADRIQFAARKPS